MVKDYSKIGSSPRWSKEEIKLLEREYPSKGPNIPNLLKSRTKRAIYRKASEKGLKFIGNKWSDKEIKELKEKYPSKGPNIPNLRARHSRHAIIVKAFELGVKCVNDGKIKPGEHKSPKTEFGKVHPSKFIKRPTKPERRLIRIINEYALPLKYVGTGKVIIGQLNPDFISTNDKKKIVEIFSDYWHGRTSRFYPHDWRRTEKGRRSYFNRFGYETLILWTSEMEKMTDREIASRVGSFLNG